MSDRYVKIGTVSYSSQAGFFYESMPGKPDLAEGDHDVFVKLPPVPPRPTVWLNNARTLGVTFEHRHYVVPPTEPNGSPMRCKSIQDVIIKTTAFLIGDHVVEQLLTLPTRTVQWETAQGARVGGKDA